MLVLLFLVVVVSGWSHDSPHSHSPHSPHIHSPHSHTPHSHSPHSHNPHSHTPDSDTAPPPPPASGPLPRIYYTPDQFTFNDTDTYTNTTQTFLVRLEEPIICPDQNRPCRMILNYTSTDPRINTPEMLIWDADADFNAWQETRNFTLTYEPFAGCYLYPQWDARPPWQNRTGLNVLIDQVHPNVTSELYNGFNPYLEINLPPPVDCITVSVENIEDLLEEGTIDDAVEDVISTVTIVIITISSVFGGLCLCCGLACVYIWFDRRRRQNLLITPKDNSEESAGLMYPSSLTIQTKY